MNIFCCCTHVKLMKENPQFVILNDVVSHSRFPLAEIFGNSADPAIDALSDGIMNVYLGTPLKDAVDLGKESCSK